MKFLEQVAEKEDLELLSQTKDCIEFEYWSDLGEDVLISLSVDKMTKDQITRAMYEYWQSFDAEEHATEWFNMKGEHGAPTSLRALLNDADEQEKKLESIFWTMKKLSERK